MKMRTNLLRITLLTAIPLTALSLTTDPDGFDAGSGTNEVGEQSAAIGEGNTALSNSLAAGESAVAQWNSIALGENVTANYRSVSLGYHCYSYVESMSIGYYNNGGHKGVNFGMGNRAYGNSMAIGGLNDVDDRQWSSGTYNPFIYNVALGTQNSILLGEANTLLGFGNISVNTVQAQTLGAYLIAQDHTVALGRYNDPEAEGEKVLVVGNGTDSENRSNALEVHQDGTVVINKPQGDISMGIYGN